MKIVFLIVLLCESVFAVQFYLLLVANNQPVLFTLGEYIGHGGGGIVCHATYNIGEGDQHAAVKMVGCLKDLGENSFERNTARNEIETYLNVRGDEIGVMNAHGDNIEFDGREHTVITMPFYTKIQTLTGFLCEPNSLDIIIMAQKLVNRLETLYYANRVHRDIKPENIMMDGNNIRFIDFGLTYSLTNKKYPEHGIFGTERYIAPTAHKEGRDPKFFDDRFSVAVALAESAGIVITWREPQCTGMLALAAKRRKCLEQLLNLKQMFVKDVASSQATTEEVKNVILALLSDKYKENTEGDGYAKLKGFIAEQLEIAQAGGSSSSGAAHLKKSSSLSHNVLNKKNFLLRKNSCVQM